MRKAYQHWGQKSGKLELEVKNGFGSQLFPFHLDSQYVIIKEAWHIFHDFLDSVLFQLFIFYLEL